MHTKSKWNHAHAIRNGINAPPRKGKRLSARARAYGLRFSRKIASVGTNSPPNNSKELLWSTQTI